MTQKLTNYNPTIFPNPTSFIPERWLDQKERKRLDKYMQPFGKGSRACIGLQYVSFPTYSLQNPSLLLGCNVN